MKEFDYLTADKLFLFGHCLKVSPGGIVLPLFTGTLLEFF